MTNSIPGLCSLTYLSPGSGVRSEDRLIRSCIAFPVHWSHLLPRLLLQSVDRLTPESQAQIDGPACCLSYHQDLEDAEEVTRESPGHRQIQRETDVRTGGFVAQHLKPLPDDLEHWTAKLDHHLVPKIWVPSSKPRKRRDHVCSCAQLVGRKTLRSAKDKRIRNSLHLLIIIYEILPMRGYMIVQQWSYHSLFIHHGVIRPREKRHLAGHEWFKRKK